MVEQRYPQPQIRLFGAMSIFAGGRLIHLPYRKVAGLIAMLCVGTREYTRAELQAVFWPEKAEDEAARNLRNALTMTRRVLREVGLENELISTRRGVRLNDSAAVCLDVAIFSQSVRSESTDATMVARELEVGLAAYSGAFLEGFRLPGCPAMDAWVTTYREQYHNEAIIACSRLLNHYDSRQDAGNALRLARRLSELNYLDEKAQMALVYWCARAGDRPGAIHLYDAYVEDLADEFGAPPSPAFQSLASDLRQFRIPVRFGVEDSTRSNKVQSDQTIIAYLQAVDGTRSADGCVDLYKRIEPRIVESAALAGGWATRHRYGGYVACFAGRAGSSCAAEVRSFLQSLDRLRAEVAPATLTIAMVDGKGAAAQEELELEAFSMAVQADEGGVVLSPGVAKLLDMSAGWPQGVGRARAGAG